ncbi:hypothetical protein EMIT0158MI4_150183 [Burkholderia ambifaria]
MAISTAAVRPAWSDSIHREFTGLQHGQPRIRCLNYSLHAGAAACGNDIPVTKPIVCYRMFLPLSSRA